MMKCMNSLFFILGRSINYFMSEWGERSWLDQREMALMIFTLDVLYHTVPLKLPSGEQHNRIQFEVCCLISLLEPRACTSRTFHKKRHYKHLILKKNLFFWWNLTKKGFRLHIYRLVGPVVRRPPGERKIPGSNPACGGIFWRSSHTSDFKIGTPVATLPGAWCYRVSTGTGQPGVSLLWLGEVERLISNFCLSVAARKIVWADLSLRYTSLLLGR